MPTPHERAEHNRSEHAAPKADAKSESLLELLGGARPAIEATIPPVVFVIAWMLSDNNVVIGGAN